MSSYISGLYRLSTNPAITVSLSYQTKRDNNHVYYRFKAEIRPMYPNYQSFPYNIRLDIELNNRKILSGGTLKDIYPSKWTVPFLVYFPSKTGWYQIDDIDSMNSLPCIVKIYSTQTLGTAVSEGIIQVPALENNTQNTKIKVNGIYRNAGSVYVKIGGAWKKAEKVYIKVNSVWRSG